ncbi:hypothetical protein PUNSTDRAFT_40549, partial [Punctularia strigosozonata HHB-11173 SS5]|uniref:uncharacterized protein n=1 Tax=Punctularia strigosozonata (strain HHB-11173) TaxID=741275 RepID=UPI00044174C4
LFTLCIDFFNAEGSNLHGNKNSTGIIALACLNLPVEIRYAPENLYLTGLVPGPHEPTLTELNHYIRFIVDDFLVGWHDGFFLSRTALYKSGH